MYSFYLGLNLHLKKTYAVLLDAQGDIRDERHIANEELPTYLHEVVPPKTYAVLEATRDWHFAYDLLVGHVDRVELAHPKELKAMVEQIHLLISIPPKYSVSSVMGYLKGKRALMVFDRHANLKYKYGNRHF
jgi:hypothetical protein